MGNKTAKGAKSGAGGGGSIGKSVMRKSTTKKLNEKKIRFLETNTGMSRSEIEEWHNQFVVRNSTFYLS